MVGDDISAPSSPLPLDGRLSVRLPRRQGAAAAILEQRAGPGGAEAARRQRGSTGVAAPRHGRPARHRHPHGGTRAGKTGCAREGNRHPREGGRGEAEGEIPQPGPEARRLRLPDEEAAERAKILRFRRLQHGQGEDEEQAAAERGARQEPGDGRPHPHAAGPPAAKILACDQQAGRVACAHRAARPPGPAPEAAPGLRRRRHVRPAAQRPHRLQPLLRRGGGARRPGLARGGGPGPAVPFPPRPRRPGAGARCPLLAPFRPRGLPPLALRSRRPPLAAVVEPRGGAGRLRTRNREGTRGGLDARDPPGAARRRAEAGLVRAHPPVPPGGGGGNGNGLEKVFAGSFGEARGGGGRRDGESAGNAAEGRGRSPGETRAGLPRNASQARNQEGGRPAVGGRGGGPRLQRRSDELGASRHAHLLRCLCRQAPEEHKAGEVHRLLGQDHHGRARLVQARVAAEPGRLGGLRRLLPSGRPRRQHQERADGVRGGGRTGSELGLHDPVSPGTLQRCGTLGGPALLGAGEPVTSSCAYL